MMKKMGWIGERLCLLCATFFCSLILIQSIQTALSKWHIISTAGFLCGAAIIWMTIKYWPFNERQTGLILFGIRFSIAMTMILIISAQPVQDFNTMYTAAQEVAQGERGYLDNIYFYYCAYQTGFVWYESLLLRLFGPGQFSLQVMNALWLGGMGVLVYKIAQTLLPQRIAVAISILYAVYPAPYFLSAVLTNQHIATFFFYLAIWLLVREDELSLHSAIIAGASIAVGNVMRPIGMVLILAILCWRVFQLLLQDTKNWKRHLINTICVLLVYFSVFSLCSSTITWSGLNPEGLSDNQPIWKLVLGLNQESDGAWNREDYENYRLLPTEKANATMREVVRERLHVKPVELLKLAVRKSALMWGDNEYMYWGFGHLNGEASFGPLTVSQYTQFLTIGDKGVYVIIFTLALLGVLSLLRQGTHHGNPSLLLAFLVCGYYVAHLIVEVQTRYRYFLLPTVFILGGYGLCALTNQKTTLY